MSSSPDRQRRLPTQLEIVDASAARARSRHRPHPVSRPREPPTDGREPGPPDPRWPSVAVAPSSGPSKLRVGVVSGAAVALAVGAVATSFAATPTPRATTTQPGAAAISLLPAVLDPAVDPRSASSDLGRFGARGGFREITVSAISGSNVTLTTDDGWTRTIAITDDVELTKGGQDIAVSDLAVGDQVRFAQTRNDDGTYTVTAIAVVVPHVSGTVSELSDSGLQGHDPRRVRLDHHHGRLDDVPVRRRRRHPGGPRERGRRARPGRVDRRQRPARARRPRRRAIGSWAPSPPRPRTPSR